MKTFMKTAAVAGLALAMAGCSNMTPRERNTAAGAAIGGVAGNVLGGGSTAGTVGGAVAGGVVGHNWERIRR